MKSWVIGGLAAACVGLGAYLCLARKEAPAPVSHADPPAVAPQPPSPPPPPAVLGEVVEVADLEPLLDPRVVPAGGVPFDPEPAAVPATSAGVPDRIPPAVD